MTDDTDDVPDGEHIAVVDRFEGDLAVLEVTTPDGLRQLVVDESELPEDGRHQDAVLEVTVDSQELMEAMYNERETESRAESAQDRFDQLSNRLGSDTTDDH
ncbi:DUF3006 domain-containing protein [Halobaculum rubrum]|uniref:DUF3006 domain-containing protein n=1 Tax=Halobaculum rubrum TaxID=2872158 RepID=UPI001CA3D798|nr:DUF3006 domain-containing protein [Halobaculum rubrum]QZY01177.1 DUF3006 domain-containing protein [Halobaculum rubrum]